jgi:hypothetical protein
MTTTTSTRPVGKEYKNNQPTNQPNKTTKNNKTSTQNQIH